MTIYNHALFRTIQAPIQNTLKELDEALEKVVSGALPANQLGLEEATHSVAQSLEMLDRRVLSTLTKSIEGAVKGVNRPERSGWDHIQVQTVARHLLDLVRSFQRHLQDLASGGDELHVRLWPLWKKLNQSMGLDEPDIYALFEVDPNFNDERFSPRSPESILEIVLGDGQDGRHSSGVYGRFSAAIGLVEVARSTKEMEDGIQAALDELNRLYALRYKRFYQAYWLILRARLSVGLMKSSELLDQRKEWLALLRDTAMQIRKFGENHRRVKVERLIQAIQPLLKPWPEEWSRSHPILAELDRRFGLSVFWQAVDEILNDSQDGAAAQFFSRQKELDDALGLLKTTWNRFVSQSDEQQKVALAQFLRNLLLFLPKKAWFPGGLADPLFDGLKTTGDKLAERLKIKEPREVDESVALEVAATILLLEELVERRARWAKELEVRIQSRAHRLGLALDGRGAELRSMAPLRWDSKWRERQANIAIQTAMGLVSGHLDKITKALGDLSRGEDVEEIRERLDELRGRSSLVGKVLLTLRQPLAGEMALGLVPLIEKTLAGENVEQNLAVLAKGMASLSGFLLASRHGNSEGEAALAPGFDALFGEGAFLHRAQQENGLVVESLPAPVEHAPERPVQAVEPVVEDMVPPAVVQASPASVARNLRAGLLGEGAVDEASDEEIVQVFLEEADVALEEIGAQRVILNASPSDEEAWTTLKRQFHTLKGSGKISGLMALGEVAFWVEDRLSDAIMSNEVYGPALDRFVALAALRLNGWYDQLRQGRAQVLVQASDVYDALGEAYAPEQLDVDPDVESAEEGFEVVWPGDEPVPSPEVSVEPIPLSDPDADVALAGDALDDAEGEARDESLGDELDLRLMAQAEAQQHADTLAAQIIHREMGGEWEIEAIHLASHTLASLVQDEEWQPMVRLAKAIERASEAGAAASVVSDELWFDGLSLMRDMGNSLAAGFSCPDDEDDVAGHFESSQQGEWEEGSSAEIDVDPVQPEVLDFASEEALIEGASVGEEEGLSSGEESLGQEEQASEEEQDGQWGWLGSAIEEGAEAPSSVAGEEATDSVAAEEEPVIADPVDGLALVERAESEEPLSVASEDLELPPIAEDAPESTGLVEAPAAEEVQATASEEPLAGADSVEVEEEALSERELAWSEAFEGINEARQGLAKMARALMILYEMDQRDS